MRKSRLTKEQMVAVLREPDRTSVAAATKKHKVSNAIIYVWRKHFGQMEANDVKRLKALELRNARLKKLLAERDLSQRHACGLVGVSRSTMRYELRMRIKDAPTIDAMKTLSTQYPRYGYRRIRIFLQSKGMKLSWSRTHGIWRCAGLQLPKKRPRRRIAASRPRPFTPLKVNTVWAYDFVFDTTADGQKIKCLPVDVTGSICSRQVIDVLSTLVSAHGAPMMCMRSDNGLEFGPLDAPRVQTAVSAPSTTRRLPGMFDLNKPSKSGREPSPQESVDRRNRAGQLNPAINR